MWAAVAFSIVLILGSPGAGVVRGALRSAFPQSFTLIVGGSVCGLVAALLLLVVAGVKAHRGRRLALIGSGLAISLAYVLYARTGNASVDVVEATHFVQYGFLTWLFYRVWRSRGDVSMLLLPLAAGLIVATCDEWLQWFVPERVGEMRDVAMDGVALIAGLLVSVGAYPPPGWKWSLNPGSARRLAMALAAGAGLFALFLQSVHVGYEIRDSAFGSFLSAFSREALEGASRQRAAEWAGRDPGAPSRFSREDQYRSEAVWHVQRRNEYATAGRFAEAWAENLILERYFAPALDLHGPRTGAGYRWPPEQRAQIASRVADDRHEYASDANPYPIYSWSKGTMWAIVGAMIIAILAAGALIERRVLALAMAVAASIGLAPKAATLDLYFIDVEGGQATLVVTPSHESMLIDAGYAGARDADRIMAAVRDARLARIDVLVITHFHADHVGGVPDLAARIPIRTFVDYGAPGPTDPAAVAPYEAYDRVRRGRRHIQPRPGDRLPVTGAEVVVLSAAGSLMAPRPGTQAESALNCRHDKRDDDPTENARSIGLRVEYGRFRFLDLGDLGWNMLWRLACPTPALDGTDVYLVPHHGDDDVNVPTLLELLRPRIAIVNNGPTKGGAPLTLAALQEHVDVWQLHRAKAAGAANATDNRLANLDDGTTGFAFKVQAHSDGRFTIVNQRTGRAEAYAR